jgi:hypothetical protein
MTGHSKNDDGLAETFDRLFPWTADTRLPLPRFGKAGPTAPKPLPTPGGAALEAACDGAIEGLEKEMWTDDDLGMTVHLRKVPGPEGDELRAHVHCNREVGDGLTASVVLMGEDPDRYVRRTVPLQDLRRPGGGARGEASLGTIAEIVDAVGGSVRLDAFLVETSRPKAEG